MSQLHIQDPLQQSAKVGLAPQRARCRAQCPQVLGGPRDHLQAESGGTALWPAVVLPGQPVPPLPSTLLQVQVTPPGLEADPTAGERGAMFGGA